MTVWLIALVVALIVCAALSRKSDRKASQDVRILLIALLPPIVGNLILTLSTDELVSTIGSYIYFIGLDFTVLAALRFTASYCNIKYKGTMLRRIVWAFVIADIAQFCFNPFFTNAFYLEPVVVENSLYWALVPLIGQTFHRAVAYGIFFISLGIFGYKTFTVPRVYVERYAIILVAMVFCGLLETFFVVSRTPIDRSMIAFGLFGVLVYFFTLYYRPVRLLDGMLANVVTDMKEAVYFFEKDGQCIYANSLGRDILGLAHDEEDLSGCMLQLAELVNNRELMLQEQWTCDRVIEEKGGKLFMKLEFDTLKDNKGKRVGAYLKIRNTTEEENLLQEQRDRANHDRLTGLYNKEYLYERARELLDSNPDVEYSVVGTDISNFKLVNDIFSKDFGDRMLKWVADLVRESAVEGSIYGRISGDRFGAVVPSRFVDKDFLEGVFKNTLYHDEKTDIEYSANVHAGIYEISDRDIPVSVMFDRAFLSVNSIKNDYQQHVASYDEKMRDDMLWQQKVSSQLEEAIEQGQIQPYLQPMVNEGGETEGAEVLVRWIHPEEGFLSPARFIPIFEENGMIARLDVYMWECACKLLKEWERRGVDLFVSVNISPKDFYFMDVYKTIRNLTERYQVNPQKLRLEITETVMMSDMEKRLAIIENLRNDGYLVEMDDFGSGYSSLNMLKDIPVDVLKIDMMFLYKTKNQDKAHTILKTIIDLSGELGIPSVTEGVETAEQLDMLVNMGCRLFQGYFFAKPMPVSEFEKTYLAA